MKKLTIKWQRLLVDGRTCGRCGSTEEELEKAKDLLSVMLRPRGIEVVLEKDVLTFDEFRKNPLSSNRIWINGIPIEDLLSGSEAESPCCDVCGSYSCRTVNIGGSVYESIPSELIVKAALIAVDGKKLDGF
ncbi:MAG: DUF2703 domain-containing protein [Syntrophales bacterium]|nr:DUF2703 domain-containing protein [Syntrophales bacterium]